MRLPRREPKDPPKALDPGLGALARAAHADAPSDQARTAPSAELCLVGGELVEALELEERRGGRLHDVLARDRFRELHVPAESDVVLPRPGGRWEIVLREGDDRERVIGLAGGGWEVGGLRRLAGLTRLDGRVTVDDAGREDRMRPPPKELDAEVAKLGGATAIGSRLNGASGLEARGVGVASLGVAYALGDRPPRWHRDPTERHDMRFWDGTRWTRFVFDRAGHVPRA